jgi:hypothetical protein
LLLLLLVEVSEVGGLGEDEAEKSGPTSDVYFETSKVFRSFTSEVDLGSDNLWMRANCSVYVLNCRMLEAVGTHVSDTLSDKHDGSGGHSFSGTGSVQVGPSVQQWLKSSEQHGNVITSYPFQTKMYKHWDSDHANEAELTKKIMRPVPTNFEQT